jgi:hypothetical protein
LFPGDPLKLACRQSSILIDAMRYSPPLTSLSFFDGCALGVLLAASSHVFMDLTNEE